MNLKMRETTLPDKVELHAYPRIMKMKYQSTSDTKAEVASANAIIDHLKGEQRRPVPRVLPRLGFLTQVTAEVICATGCTDTM